MSSVHKKVLNCIICDKTVHTKKIIKICRSANKLNRNFFVNCVIYIELNQKMSLICKQVSGIFKTLFVIREGERTVYQQKE